jgi:hypothetical protein
LCLKVPPLLCINFLEVSRTKANIVIYNHGLNLGLNRMFKGYVRDNAHSAECDMIFRVLQSLRDRGRGGASLQLANQGRGALCV